MKQISARIHLAIAATALIVALVALLIMGRSFAWFSTGREVTAAGLTIQTAGGPPVTATLSSYGVLSITEDPSGDVYVTENAVDSVTGERVQRFALPTHDPQSIFANTYKRALVLAITVTPTEESARNVRITVDTETQELISTDGAEGFAWSSNYLSNAVTFAPAISGDGVTAVKQSGGLAFAVKNGNAMEKKTSITLYEGEVIGTATLYFIMEYNHDFIEYLNSRLMTAGYFGTVTYANDIVITVS